MTGGGTQIGNQSPRLKWEKKGEEELKKKTENYTIWYTYTYTLLMFTFRFEKKKNRENQGRGREKQAISPFSCLLEKKINGSASFFFVWMSCRRSIDCSLLTALGAHPKKQNRTVFSLLNRVKYQREKGKPPKRRSHLFRSLSLKWSGAPSPCTFLFLRCLLQRRSTATYVASTQTKKKTKKRYW